MAEGDAMAEADGRSSSHPASPGARFSEDGPPAPESWVALLHGFTGSRLSWQELLPGLDRRGFQGRPVDLPGHGRRARGGAGGPAHGASRSGGAHLAWALEAIEDDAGDAPYMVGYSMGGRIALHYALRHQGRLRGLVLESASPGLATEEERSRRRSDDEALARRIVEEGVERFVDGWERLPLFATHLHLPPVTRSALRARRVANDAAGLAAALRGLGTGALPSLWDRLEEVDVPTLVLTGEADAKFVAIGRQMVQRLPDARFVVVPGAGHTVHLERPEIWLEEVTGFFTSLEGGSD